MHQRQEEIDQAAGVLQSSKSKWELGTAKEVLAVAEQALAKDSKRLLELERRRNNFETEWNKAGIDHTGLYQLKLECMRHTLNVSALESTNKEERHQRTLKDKDSHIATLQRQLKDSEAAFSTAYSVLATKELVPDSVARYARENESLQNLSHTPETPPRLALPPLHGQSKIPRPRLAYSPQKANGRSASSKTPTQPSVRHLPSKSVERVADRVSHSPYVPKDWIASKPRGPVGSLRNR